MFYIFINIAHRHRLIDVRTSNSDLGSLKTHMIEPRILWCTIYKRAQIHADMDFN